MAKREYNAAHKFEGGKPFMKKVLAMVLALALLLPACALGENVVKIGIYEPASGDNGAGG